MKYLWILLLIGWGTAVSAQLDTSIVFCQDKITLTGKEKFTGRIVAIDSVSGMLHLSGWSGIKMAIPLSSIARIEQECHPRKGRIAQEPFLRKGWYGVTRLGLHSGASGAGFLLHQSFGYRFGHALHLGAGMGIDQLSIEGEPLTWPVYAEVRSYLSPGRFAPFVAAGAGWAWMGKTETDGGATLEDWDGGRLHFIHLGCRVRNHFLFYGGIRVQQQTRHWDQPWWGSRGTDEIVKRRMEVGLAILI